MRKEQTNRNVKYSTAFAVVINVRNTFGGVFLMLLLSFYANATDNKTAGMGPAKGQYGFIENKGQIVDQSYKPNPGVKFLLCRPGFNVQLRKTGFSYDTYTDSLINDVKELSSGKPGGGAQHPNFARRYHRVDVELLNCNPDAQMVTMDASTSYLNYFTAGTPQGGISNVHYYGEVLYQDIYPSIDLEFKTSASGSAEYDFIVHPGGNVNDIKLAYNGAHKVSLENNMIKVAVASGSFTEHIPTSYLKASGQKVKVSYIRSAENIFSFHVPGNIAITSDLIIDPTPCLDWGTYIGGAGSQFGTGDMTESIGIDGSGNVVVAGSTNSSTNIATSGTYEGTFPGGFWDIFISKLDPTGTALVWGTYYGGKGLSYCWAMALDADGNEYITGSYGSSSMATPGAYKTSTKGQEALVAKFNSTGTSLLWGTFYGTGLGNGTSSRYIAVDASKNVYIAGYTSSTDSIATNGSYLTTSTGKQTTFVAKFNSTGSALLWGTYFGGKTAGNDLPAGIALGTNNNVYILGVTGNTTGTGITTPGAFLTTFSVNPNSSTEYFIAEFNPALSGNAQLVWGTYSGLNYNAGGGIALDANNNIYVTENTYNDTITITKGAYQAINGTPVGAGTGTPVIAKFNPSLVGSAQLVWGTFYCTNGAGYTNTNGIALDACGNATIVGWTGSVDSIATSQAYQTTFGGNRDAVVAKFDSVGAHLLWGTYYGGSGSDQGQAIALSGNSVYITGQTASTSGIATLAVYDPNYSNTQSGGWNAFVAEFGCNIGCNIACPPATVRITGTKDSICAGTPVTFTAITTNGFAPSYQWKVNNQNVGTNINTYSNSAFNNNDVVTCIVISTVCAAPDTSKSNSVTLTVNPQAVAGTVSAVKDSICENTVGHLIVSGSSGGNIQWQSSADSLSGFTNISGATSNTYATQPLAQSTYFRVIVGTTCADTSNSFKINTLVLPVASFTYSVKGQQVTFDGSSSTGATGYSWNFADGSPTSTLVNPTHTYDSVKTYHVCLTVKNNSNCNFTLCENVTTNTTGTSNVNIENNWLVYPDPFTDQLYISSQSLIKINRIAIYDVLGRKVMDEPITNEAGVTHKLDVSGLGEGVYYLRINTQDGDYIKSVIKQ